MKEHSNMRKLSFRDACAQYVHRYTLEHIPRWAIGPAANGRFYAPHYASDQEWYDNTKFYGESYLATRDSCYSTGLTFTLGKWLDASILTPPSPLPGNT